MKKIINLLLFVIVAAVFTDCKKGEDDPLLSLRTRKARVVGRWEVTSGTSSSSSSFTGFSTTSNTSYSKNSFSTNWSTTVNNNTSSGAEVGTFAYSLTFEKGGKFTFTQTMGGNYIITSGTWNFTGKVGDLKNKEQIILYRTASTQGSSTSSYATNQVFKTYNIVELKNKLMVLKSESSSFGTGGSTNTSKEELTLEQ